MLDCLRDAVIVFCFHTRYLVASSILFRLLSYVPFTCYACGYRLFGLVRLYAIRHIVCTVALFNRGFVRPMAQSMGFWFLNHWFIAGGRLWVTMDHSVAFERARC